MDPQTADDLRHEGWFFLTPDALPAKWHDRAIPVFLLPLHPGEAAAVLEEPGALPRVRKVDLALVGLVARGISAPEIARELDIALRTVYRRLARLRSEFGAGSTAELAAELARRGF